jgi:hypothetical protein
MFKAVLKRENSPLNYEFVNAVFSVESFNYDIRRADIDVRVVGFADERAYGVYKDKLTNNEYHDLERSMVLNRTFTVKKADVDSAQQTDALSMLTAIEVVLQEKEAMFQSA